jgi:hypothetical protein
MPLSLSALCARLLQPAAAHDVSSVYVCVLLVATGVSSVVGGNKKAVAHHVLCLAGCQHTVLATCTTTTERPSTGLLVSRERLVG